ncbi:MAG: ABC transporter permease [Gemmatimonadota bacterium]
MRRIPSYATLRATYRAHIEPSIRIALDAVSRNKLRAGLTSLGILFGVASVIAMLAIGSGAEQEILEQLRLLGTNNFVIQPIEEQEEGEARDQGDKEQKRFSPGLNMNDARSIKAVLPRVDAVSGELVLQTLITREGHRRSGKLVGVDTTYFRLLNLSLAQGRGFTPIEVEGSAPVAIIGHGVKTRFFTTEAPLGRRIKVGENWLTVVGVLTDRQVPQETAGRLGIRDANMDVYVPLSTGVLRFRNRSQVTAADIQRLARRFNNDNDNAANLDEAVRAERANYHQLDRIIVRVNDAEYVASVADVARRMLTRRHNQVVDFEISVPELLLKQEQRTKTIFNIVLGAIASISLIVGGIGIMNIMLASVLERIREIGVRRALGATRRDILGQFLAEATMISLGGGLAGIVLGFTFSLAIEKLAGIETIVSFASVAVAFAVSITVGLVFGIVPAWRASEQDPVVSLRYE